MTRILIAEDEKEMRRFYEDFLGMAYRRVDLRFAETGEEAINTLEEMVSQGKAPNLVITDNQMPPGKKTGMDVIDYVKDKHQNIPVLMVAGENQEMTVKRTALEKGAAYLPKPVAMRTFLETVKAYATKTS